MPLAIGHGHCFDRTRTRGRHGEWYANACCCAGSRKLTIFVKDPLYSYGGYDYGRGQLDAKEGSLGQQSALLLASEEATPMSVGHRRFIAPSARLNLLCPTRPLNQHGANLTPLQTSCASPEQGP